jgi:hypothetical protein
MFQIYDDYYMPVLHLSCSVHWATPRRVFQRRLGLTEAGFLEYFFSDWLVVVVGGGAGNDEELNNYYDYHFRTIFPSTLLCGSINVKRLSLRVHDYICVNILLLIVPNFPSRKDHLSERKKHDPLTNHS